MGWRGLPALREKYQMIARKKAWGVDGSLAFHNHTALALSLRRGTLENMEAPTQPPDCELGTTAEDAACRKVQKTSVTLLMRPD